MDQMTSVFVENFNRLLNENHWNMLNFAQKFNFPYTTVQKWSKGLSYPRSKKMEEIANCFGVSVDDLIQPQKKPEETNQVDDLRDFYLLNEKDRHLVRQIIRLMLNEYKAS